MKVGDMVKSQVGFRLERASTGIIIQASWQEPPTPESSEEPWHCSVLWSDCSVTREDAFYLEVIDETN